jgi:hypothetical protein
VRTGRRWGRIGGDRRWLGGILSRRPRAWGSYMWRREKSGRGERIEIGLTCGPHHYLSATAAKPPSKIVRWPIGNIFKSLMVKITNYRVRWPKPKFNYSSAKMDFFPFKKSKDAFIKVLSWVFVVR